MEQHSELVRLSSSCLVPLVRHSLLEHNAKRLSSHSTETPDPFREAELVVFNPTIAKPYHARIDHLELQCHPPICAIPLERSSDFERGSKDLKGLLPDCTASVEGAKVAWVQFALPSETAIVE